MQALDKTGFTYAISSLWNKIYSKNSATQTSIDTHIADKANPHGVTAAQAGVEASTTNGNIVLDNTETNVYTHPTYSTTATTTTSAPAFGGTFTAIDTITTDNGHTTAKRTKTVTIPSAVATTSVAGLMSSTDKTKLDGIDEGANAYTHPTYSTSSSTTSSSPAFGGTFTALSAITTSNGHTTAKTTRTVTIPSNVATTSAKGLMSADDKTKVDALARSATYVIAASDSVNSASADYTCTGTSDDTVIQTAIDALPTGGGKIVLLEGTYNISAQISLASKSNITIEGQGAGTILTTTSDINALYLYHSTGCRISSLAITTSVESPADGCAITSDNADNNIISNCIIDGNYNGIYMDWSSGENLIDGNFISNCSGAGIYVGRGQSSDGGHNRITNNHISECGCAIYIYYSYYNVIANNFVYDGSGEIDDINSRGAKNNIVGNTILNGYYGIYIYDNQSLVSGNVVYGMSMSAIRLSTSCEDTLVIGNHTLNGSVVDGGSNNTVVNNLT